MRKWDKEEISKLVLICDTYKDILIKIGYKPIETNYSKLKRLINEWDLVFIVNRNKFVEKNELISIVESSFSYRECLSKIKIRNAGGNFKTLKKYIEMYNIDISHFVSLKKRHVVYSMLDILVENSSFSRTSLKKRLYNEGLRERKCCLCGQGEEWNGMKISLILDHINGVYNDNRLENLRIVCPNCNAGLDTFAGKNNKNKNKKHINKCICGEYIQKSSNKCSVCSSISLRKVDRPSLDVLLEDIAKLGYSGTGRKYGVSDNSIRKWIKLAM